MTYVKVDNPDRPTAVLETKMPRVHVEDIGKESVQHPLLQWARLGHAADLRRFGWVEALVDKPNVNPDTHRIEGPEFVIAGGRATERYTSRPLTREEKGSNARMKRNNEYQVQLGGEVDPVVEALFAKVKALEAANTAAPEQKFDEMAARIDAINAANPDP